MFFDKVPANISFFAGTGKNYKVILHSSDSIVSEGRPKENHETAAAGYRFRPSTAF